MFGNPKTDNLLCHDHHHRPSSPTPSSSSSLSPSQPPTTTPKLRKPPPKFHCETIIVHRHHLPHQPPQYPTPLPPSRRGGRGRNDPYDKYTQDVIEYLDTLREYTGEAGICPTNPPIAEDVPRGFVEVQPCYPSSCPSPINSLKDLMDETCPVCYEEFKDENEVITTYCSHAFHTRCLLPWLSKKNTCPTCRAVYPLHYWPFLDRRCQTVAAAKQVAKSTLIQLKNEAETNQCDGGAAQVGRVVAVGVVVVRRILETGCEVCNR
ncbi:hypothetical protein RND71_038713 [Anisodus tanguticus]|uniref:RING-type domain-containing protein n=1 Tax=Anisodus tanguticus TaxID=243964 RepID=A0AAE1R2R3_9SOLA|nr:hypothetical protein RND71_038713 [Anisodus tanguticus]